MLSPYKGDIVLPFEETLAKSLSSSTLQDLDDSYNNVILAAKASDRVEIPLTYTKRKNSPYNYDLFSREESAIETAVMVALQVSTKSASTEEILKLLVLDDNTMSNNSAVSISAPGSTRVAFSSHVSVNH